jgi:small GTP-binding protein
MVTLTKDQITKMRIKRIEKEIRDTPYHKKTEHHIGRLRAKLSKLKGELQDSGTRLRKTSARRGGYAVKKQGDATVTLVGSPSVGKSTLLNKLTNAKSKIAPYTFTTVTVIPGMMNYGDAKIQILDVPGLIEGAETGKGRGREVLSVIRGSDLLLIMCDVDKVNTLKAISKALEESGIRINQNPPKVTIEKKVRGGTQIISNFKQDFSKETVKDIAKEFRIVNAEITIKEKLTIDRLIDAFSPNRVYIPAIYIINKIELKRENITTNHYYDLKHSSKDFIYISAEKNINLTKLKNKIWKKLNLIRIFLVKRGEKPNTNNPLIMKKSDTLAEVAKKIGKEFAEDKTGAKIWGKGAKFPGQQVSLTTAIRDGMLVRFI